jgi:hypothetical protein
MHSYSTHPAFNTSFQNKEMFNWPTDTYKLSLDGCQLFTFRPVKAKNKVYVERQARNGYKNGRYQVTGNTTYSLKEGRALYKRLLQQGAIKA